MAEKIVVVIDDDTPTRRRAAEALRHVLGAHVLPMRSGEPAIAWVRALRPALVLTELRGAGFGAELIDRLARDPDTAAIPVVAVGEDGPDGRDRAARAGAAGFVAKPFTTTELVAVVSRCLVALTARDPRPVGLAAD